MKTNFLSGKISIAVLIISLVVSFFLLGKSLTTVSAGCCNTGHQWVFTSETQCVSNGECGTTAGTKSVTYTCQSISGGNNVCSPEHQEEVSAGYWSCSADYELYWSNGSHEWRCKKDIPDQYAVRYADKIDIQPGPGHNWQCPSNDSAYTSQDSSKPCSREVKIQDGYTDRQDAIWVAPTYRTVAADVKTDTGIACTLSEPDYNSCAPAQDCPISCGYEGGTVPDGMGGTVTCGATDPCEDSRTHVCPNPEATNYDENIDEEIEVADQEVCTYASPTPVPTANPDVCPNLDGIQLSIPDTYHLDAGGVNCVQYQFGGPSSSSSTGGEAVLGTATVATGGQVLGTSSMAATGVALDNLFAMIFSLGSVVASFGIRKISKLE